MGKYYFVRVIIAVIIIFVCKIDEEEKMTKKKRFWAIIAALLMLPIEDFSKKYLIFANPAVLMGTIVILYGLYLKIFVKARNKHYEIETLKDIDSLNREIKFEYNPSIVGYLVNQELKLKDLSADILNLYNKKIINIKIDEAEKYIVEYGENYEKYKENLNLGDKYIIEKLLKTSSKFDFLEWKYIILNEYKLLSLSKNKEYMSDKKFYMIIVTIVVIGTIMSKIIFNSIGMGIVVCALIALAFVVFYATIYHNTDNKNLNLTLAGKEEIKKCLKLKRFMEEYTLLEDKDLQEISIYEGYIPYAVALGVNKKYYGTMFEIFGKKELKNIVEDIDVIEYYMG